MSLWGKIFALPLGRERPTLEERDFDLELSNTNSLTSGFVSGKKFHLMRLFLVL